MKWIIGFGIFFLLFGWLGVGIAVAIGTWLVAQAGWALVFVLVFLAFCGALQKAGKRRLEEDRLVRTIEKGVRAAKERP